MTNIKIILASGSPRRKELLAQAGYDFDVCPSLSDEDLEPMAPSEYVMLLAKKKADEVCNRIIAQDVVRRVKKLPERFVVLGADTVVSLNGRILGKPYDYDEIIQYLATNEPFDKAGSYGIQGKGGLFVKGIEGDYNNVVGLPLARVYHELDDLIS